MNHSTMTSGDSLNCARGRTAIRRAAEKTIGSALMQPLEGRVLLAGLTVGSPLPLVDGYHRSTVPLAPVNGMADPAVTRSVTINGSVVPFDPQTGVYGYGSTASTTFPLISSGDEWTYLDNGSNPGVSWTQFDFNDGLWGSGPSQLGYGEGDEQKTLSFGNDPNNKPITTYFRRKFSVADASQMTALTLHLLADDAAVVYINGQPVVSQNLPRTFTRTTPASRQMTSSDEGRFFTYAIDPAFLTDGQNIIAIEVHQQAANTDDLSFDLKMEGSSSTRLLIPPGGTWKYLDNGTNQSGFAAIDFPDGSWSSGAAQLGYGEGDEATTVLFGGSSSNKHITTYFRRHFNVSNLGEIDGLTLRLLVDDGAAIYINGQRALTKGLPDTFGFQTPASDDQNTPTEELEHIALNVDPSLLVEGDNVIAVEVHQNSPDSSDISLELTLESYSIASDGGIAVQPGITRALVEAFDGPDGSGNKIAQGFADIWYDAPVKTVNAGTLSGNTIWVPEGGAYHVTGDLVIPAGSTLTLMPGTTVMFGNGAGITINGRLVSEGTQYAQNRFTRVPGSAANWDGLQFVNSMADNRLVHTILEHSSPANDSGMVGLTFSNLLIDHSYLAHATRRRIRSEDSALIVRNSEFADIYPGNQAPLNDNFSEHIWGRRIPANGQWLIENNIFGTSKGHNDLLDFDPGLRPGNPARILNNVFMGGGDDAMDLEGDTYIEGNLIMNMIKDVFNTGVGNANAMSLGAGFNYFVARNVFVNLQQIAQVKDDSFLTFVNNTADRISEGAIYFLRPEGTSRPGKGALVDSSIFWNTPTTFADVTPTIDLKVRRSIVGPEWVSYGTGNITQDPLFRDAAMEDFSLLPGSPAIGTGANGLDMGALVPAGASLSGVPAAVTGRTYATLNVGGPLITHFRIREGDGPWSGEIPVGTPISMVELEDGQYTISVIGKNVAGVWQSEEDALVRTWRVVTQIDGTEGNDTFFVRENTAGVTEFFVNTPLDGPPTLSINTDEIGPFSINGLGGDDTLIQPLFLRDDPDTAEAEGILFAGGAGNDMVKVSVDNDDVVYTLHENILSHNFDGHITLSGVEEYDQSITGTEGGDLHITAPWPYRVNLHGVAGVGNLNIFGTPEDDTISLTDALLDWGPLHIEYRGINGVGISAGAGNDTLVVNSRLSDASASAYDLSGGDGTDTIRFTDEENTFASAGLANRHSLHDVFNIEVIGGGGETTLNLAGNSTAGAVNIAGSNARLNLLQGAALKAQSLTITDGLVDVGTGGLVLTQQDLGALRDSILSGRGSSGGVASGKWNGTTGITSSSAAEAFLANNKETRSVGYARNAELLQKFTTFLGQEAGDDDILVRFTKNADANLDGVVNNNDITTLAGFYRPGQAGKHWHQADFNYDGEVNNNDITTLAGFYAPAEPPIAAASAESEVILRRDVKNGPGVKSFFADTSTILD